MHEIVKKWADDNHVSTVNRSYGEQTTAPVSLAALENLVRAAMMAEREACAKVCDDKADEWADSAHPSALDQRDCALAIRMRANAQ